MLIDHHLCLTQALIVDHAKRLRNYCANFWFLSKLVTTTLPTECLNDISQGSSSEYLEWSYHWADFDCSFEGWFYYVLYFLQINRSWENIKNQGVLDSYLILVKVIQSWWTQNIYSNQLLLHSNVYFWRVIIKLEG